MPRLRRTNPGQSGITRRRRGKGWAYLDSDGSPVTDKAVRQRIDALVIPPAWQDVWITPFANGHLQAVGTDVAGRRQYLYHPDWQNSRNQQKHQRVLALGAALPRARSVVARDLTAPELTRERLLATAFRLLDAGHFRIGGEVYAESNGSYGLSTFAPRACPPPALVAGLRVHRQVRRHPYRALTTPAHPKLNWETE